MANSNHLNRIQEGVYWWNNWRRENPSIYPDLSEADLSNMNLDNVNFSRCNLNKINLCHTTLIGANLDRAEIQESKLYGAELVEASLGKADLKGAKLGSANLFRTVLYGSNLENAELFRAKLNFTNIEKANLSGAYFVDADLSNAYLPFTISRGTKFGRANLFRARLYEADLTWAEFDESNMKKANLTGAKLRNTSFYRANLEQANLSECLMLNTNFKDANLSGCNVYGISAWDLELTNALQENIIISREGRFIIKTDNIEIAQFIYLMINNAKLRNIIDTITSKVVLLLGRFSDERKPILDTLRKELRKYDYVPILFDFEEPQNRDLTETVSLIAHMSSFIIADITDPKSVPHELASAVPGLKVAVQPIQLKGSHGGYGMFNDLSKYPWVLPIYRYEENSIFSSLYDNIIKPAQTRNSELKFDLNT